MKARDKCQRLEGAKLMHDRDIDDGDTIVALYPQGEIAKNCYIPASNLTVAEYNPKYPADDPVVVAVFVNSIERVLGTNWTLASVWEFAAYGKLKDVGIKPYFYPESRLVPIRNK